MFSPNANGVGAIDGVPASAPTPMALGLNGERSLSVMRAVFGTDDGVRVVARRLMAERPVRDADHQEERDAEDDGQQDADVLSRRSVRFDEFMQFRILEPHAVVHGSVSIGGLIVGGGLVNSVRGVGVRGHESRLSLGTEFGCGDRSNRITPRQPACRERGTF